MTGNSNNEGNNDSLIIFIFVIAIIIVSYIFFAPKMQEWFLTIKMYQMKIITALVPIEINKSILHQLETLPNTDWSPDQVKKVSRIVNLYFLPIFIAFASYSAIFIKKYLYYTEYIRKRNNVPYTIDSLMQQESKVWGYIVPIKDEDLLNNTSPDWARAMKPQEFVIHNDLLNLKDDLSSLNEEKTKNAFALQLGPIFYDIDQLADYVKALAGCIAEHIFGSSLKSQVAFMEISRSYGVERKGKHDYSSGIELFEKHKNNPDFLIFFKSHAYVYTGLLGLFEHAKESGIIISKYFLWLKKRDRRLYYALNCIGRQVSWVETAGIIDHYQQERALKIRLYNISCLAALAGLKEELQNVKITTNTRKLIKTNEKVQREIQSKIGTS